MPFRYTYTPPLIASILSTHFTDQDRAKRFLSPCSVRWQEEHVCGPRVALRKDQGGLLTSSKFNPHISASPQYTVFLNDPHTADQKAKGGKEPRGYKVRLTKVAEINPEVLSRFLLGKQSNDNSVLTAITALVRSSPLSNLLFLSLFSPECGHPYATEFVRLIHIHLVYGLTLS